MPESGAFRSLGFIPSSSQWDDRVGKISGLIDNLSKQQEARRTQAEEEARQKVDAYFKLAASWGPGDWVKGGPAIARAMKEAGYDPELSQMYLSSMEKKAREGAEPDVNKSRYARLVSESLSTDVEAHGPPQPGQPHPTRQVPSGLTPFQASQYATQRMLEEDPDAFFSISDWIADSTKKIALPGEEDALAQVLYPSPEESTKEMKNYRFFAPILGREGALGMVAGGNTASKIQEAQYLISQGRDPKEVLQLLWGADPETMPKEIQLYQYLTHTLGIDPAIARGVFPGVEGVQKSGLESFQLKDLHDFRKASIGFDSISQWADTVFQTENAVGAKAMGALKSVLSKMNLDPSTANYLAERGGLVPLFARALGHTGVLTEIDVERTEALFPQMGDTREIAMMKIRSLEVVMESVRELSLLPLDSEGERQAQQIRARARAMIRRIESRGATDGSKQESQLLQELSNEDLFKKLGGGS